MKSVVNFLKKHKCEIMVGIVTSMCCDLIYKLVKVAPQSGKTIIDMIKNIFVQEISTISSIDIVISLCEFLLGIIVAIILSVMLFSLFKTKIFRFVVRGKENRLEQRIAATKTLKISTTLMLVLTCILNFYYFFLFFCIHTKNNFEICMTEIKPYISEKKYDELYSRWLQMEEYDDYKKIEKEIIKVQSENDLKKIKLIS